MFQMLSDAIEETLKRYPEAAKGLVFFLAASGLSMKEPTDVQFKWVDDAVKRMKGA